jgi:hypothetical protein
MIRFKQNLFQTKKENRRGKREDHWRETCFVG